MVLAADLAEIRLRFPHRGAAGAGHHRYLDAAARHEAQVGSWVPVGRCGLGWGRNPGTLGVRLGLGSGQLPHSHHRHSHPGHHGFAAAFDLLAAVGAIFLLSATVLLGSADEGPSVSEGTGLFEVLGHGGLLAGTVPMLRVVAAVARNGTT